MRWEEIAERLAVEYARELEGLDYQLAFEIVSFVARNLRGTSGGVRPITRTSRYAYSSKWGWRR